MMGDLQAGYDYNALLFKEDLSPAALYGGYVIVAILAAMALYDLWPFHKGRRH